MKVSSTQQPWLFEALNFDSLDSRACFDATRDVLRATAEEQGFVECLVFIAPEHGFQAEYRLIHSTPGGWRRTCDTPHPYRGEPRIIPSQRVWPLTDMLGDLARVSTPGGHGWFIGPDSAAFMHPCCWYRVADDWLGWFNCFRAVQDLGAALVF